MFLEFFESGTKSLREVIAIHYYEYLVELCDKEINPPEEKIDKKIDYVRAYLIENNISDNGCDIPDKNNYIQYRYKLVKKFLKSILDDEVNKLINPKSKKYELDSDGVAFIDYILNMHEYYRKDFMRVINGDFDNVNEDHLFLIYKGVSSLAKSKTNKLNLRRVNKQLEKKIHPEYNKMISGVEDLRATINCFFYKMPLTEKLYNQCELFIKSMEDLNCAMIEYGRNEIKRPGRDAKKIIKRHEKNLIVKLHISRIFLKKCSMVKNKLYLNQKRMNLNKCKFN